MKVTLKTANLFSIPTDRKRTRLELFCQMGHLNDKINMKNGLFQGFKH